MEKPRKKRPKDDRKVTEAKDAEGKKMASEGSLGKEDGRPDYGGWPDVDLKKNLGCG